MRGKTLTVCLVFLVGLYQPIMEPDFDSSLQEINVLESGNSATQTRLAFEWLSQHGGAEDYAITQMVTDSFGDIFVSALTSVITFNLFIWSQLFIW